MQKLSVIVPVYNVEQYLERCLDSLVTQTYSNLEIILIDDGSSDNSGAICDQYAEQFENIKVFHVANSGVSAARNLGIAKSTGDYITFCDSDDWLEVHAYGKMMEPIVEGNVDIAAFGWFVDDGHTKQINATENANCGYGGEYEFFEAFLSKAGSFGGKIAYGNYIWNKIYKRTVLNDQDGNLIKFDSSIKVAEDGLWLVSIAKNCEVSYFDSEPLYHYFINESSVMRDKQRFVETRLASQQSHLMMLEVLKEYNSEYYEIHRETCVDYFWFMIKSAPKLIDPEFLHKSFNNILLINDGKITENMANDIYCFLRINMKYKHLMEKTAVKALRSGKKKVRNAARRVKRIWQKEQKE